MILTVTLNPAVDKMYTAGELITGHTNRMRTAMSFAGGKGINVAKVLRQYGQLVCATGFLGGYAGDFIEDTLLDKRVECQFIRVEGETRSNINILADDGYATEIIEPGPLIGEEPLKEFLTLYDELAEQCEIVVLSGSAARGLPEDIYKTLIEKARLKGIRTMLDASGESLRRGIEAKPYFVKPNQKELEYIAGHKLINREAVIEAAVELHRRGIGHVAVSMGKNGLLYVCSGGVVYYARAENVQALNTAGCGDCVAASYAMSFMKRDSKEEAIRRAAAISAANATTLKCVDVPFGMAEELYESITVEKLR
ncbi:MAG: 1-phosphofructokinase family hexose kinase [Blautia sp.]|nr:1-phosphofructokinase family hexose kinase [Blautia sp.]MCM1201569.1 1-phosphofructokinase family hexose kinase [Bacteroides fragilis]